MLEKIKTMDCIEYMKEMESESVDLVMTSPPYAMRRGSSYGGTDYDKYPEWMYSVGEEIYRVLKPTGSFVLNIADTVEKGCRNLYVFKTVELLTTLFRWSDTYIWVKTNPFPTGSNKRLKNGFEYCFWFTKTNKYKFFPNEVLVPSTNKFLDREKKRKNKGAHPCINGSGMNMSKRYVSDMVRPSNVIMLPTDTTNHEHPASFPLALPTFFIKLMTEHGDTVFDPFMGGGTTLLAAKNEGRYWMGCDKVDKYVRIAKRRLSEITLFEV